jgi:serine/threonine protein phosphatase PrpC
MKNIDIPGLAMTRSMGDKVGMEAGVNAEPGKLFCLILEIITAELTKEDKFLVVATDGVWEYLENEDVKIYSEK